MQSRIDVTNNLTGDEEAGLVIERRFTSVGEDPFDAFEWIEMDVEM